MKGTIKLRNSIKINGKSVKELSYDTDQITSEMYLQAIGKAVTKGNGMTGSALQVDAGAQLMLGMYAVVADNPEYDIADIERATGSDLIQFVTIGRDFTLGREDQTEAPSEEPSETTPENIIQAFPTSEE
jgi:hypothetical protein